MKYDLHSVMKYDSQMLLALTPRKIHFEWFDKCKLYSCVHAGPTGPSSRRPNRFVKVYALMHRSFTQPNTLVSPRFSRQTRRTRAI